MTSNFREELEKKIEPGVRKCWAPPAPDLNWMCNVSGIFVAVLSYGPA